MVPSDSEVDLPSSVEDIIDLPSPMSSESDKECLQHAGGVESDVDLPDAMHSEHESVGDASDSNASLPSDYSEGDPLAMPVENIDEPHCVPRPDEGLLYQTFCHDVAELFSPPRVLPAAHSRGLSGILSLDLITGWNLTTPSVQELTLKLLIQWHVVFTMLSPPCTAFSPLQTMWNFKKMTPERRQSLWSAGMNMLEFAMRVAMQQLSAGCFFAFEHPARASSWQQQCVMDIVAQPGVMTVDFDQCMLGLCTKVSKTPTKKRTRVLTNCDYLVKTLRSYQCDKSHAHEPIQGQEGGMKRSVWAQFYPPAFVQILAGGAYSLKS